MGKTKTHAMTVLAKPEDDLFLIEARMWVREDKIQMYPITQHWVVIPVVERTEGEGPWIDRAMKTNSEDIKHRIYVDITGVTPGKDLFSIVPERTFHTEEPALPNEKTIVQLFLGEMSEMDGSTIFLIRAKGQGERGRWRRLIVRT